MLRLSDIILVESIQALREIPEGKVLINTINAHSYNTAQSDQLFADALRNGSTELRRYGITEGRKDGSTEGRRDGGTELRSYGNTEARRTEECVKYLIPDGASIVKACRWLKTKSQPKERIAGWDLFAFEMQRVNGDTELRNYGTTEGWGNENEKVGVKKVMFMGSSERVLGLIKERAAKDYPNVEVVTYSPPYKAVFSEEDNRAIISAINEAKPDLLWIGMTAPKQEKWTYQHWKELDINCHVGTIGAVFDFYAGTAKRAPLWWQRHGLEWLYRLVKEPKRMWRRYVIGNPLFIWNVMRER